MRFVTCTVHERPLRLYGHVARYPDTNPAHQILSAREPREWRPMGRPRASWLQQVDQHFKEMAMGQASAWGLARQKLLETGGKWTQRRAAAAHAPIPDLTSHLERNIEEGMISTQQFIRYSVQSLSPVPLPNHICSC